MAESPLLVTAALPYANGPLHLGHVAGVYLPADIYVRYQRLRGRDVLFLCGSDEFGVPITLTAEKEGVSPQVIVDRFHAMMEKDFRALGVSFNHYSRTTSSIHRETAQEIFRILHGKGLLKEKSQKQLYCESCSRFLPDRFVEGICPHCGAERARGDQCDTCGKWIDQVTLINPACKICGHTPVIRETTHWFLPLGDYQAWLEEEFKKEERLLWRDNVRNFCQGWFKEGLEDRAITRDLNWGVPVPLDGAKGKVLYVWFDAPIGYISATKEYFAKTNKPGDWKKYWLKQEDGNDPRLVHFIGKDNIVFHAIFFPAMLHGVGGYVTPWNIPANEYLTIEGRKISTSQNYAIWLKDYLAAFPPDPLRYCLTAIAPETRDADFSWKDFQNRNNFELADILGNFINRTLAFTQRYFDSTVPEFGPAVEPTDREMLMAVTNTARAIRDQLEAFQIRESLRTMMDLARAANKYFNDTEPWRTVKLDRARCATTINVCLQVVYGLSVMMEPYLPYSAESVRKQMQITVKKGAWNDLLNDDTLKGPLPAGHRLGEPAILFTKIENEQIAPEVEKLAQIAGKSEKQTEVKDEAPAFITYDDFMHVDLRVATIKTAERVPKADRLLRLIVDDGNGERQIVAGIAEHYDPDALPGTQILLVANLQPAKIRGIESHGMLLAARDDNGLTLVRPEREKAPGSKVS